MATGLDKSSEVAAPIDPRIPRTTFMFWNLHNVSFRKQPDTQKRQRRTQQLQDALVQLTEHYQVDILLIAEAGNAMEQSQFTGVTDPAVLEQALNGPPRDPIRRPWRFAPENHAEKVCVLHRLDGGATAIRRAERSAVPPRRCVIWRVKAFSGKEILMAAAHFPSIQYDQGDGQRAMGAALHRSIREVEKKFKHSRTIVVGDLNANPFDPGIAAAYGLNAVATERVEIGGPRNLDGESYDYFYNPMWSLFGDRTPGPPGTYYYKSSGPVCYYWNMLDQVLLRPALLGVGTSRLFDDEAIHVVTRVNDVEFCTPDGTPKSSVFSDHLPLIFSLRM